MSGYLHLLKIWKKDSFFYYRMIQVLSLFFLKSILDLASYSSKEIIKG